MVITSTDPTVLPLVSPVHVRVMDGANTFSIEHRNEHVILPRERERMCLTILESRESELYFFSLEIVNLPFESSINIRLRVANNLNPRQLKERNDC